MQAFWTAFALVFVSEMGDKSQIVSFGFGAREKLWLVLPAIFLGIALMMFVAALLGDAVGRLLPTYWLQLGSGVLFVAFGVLSLRAHAEEELEEGDSRQQKIAAFFAILVSFVISELGDKTIFATIAVAGGAHALLPVWIGSTLGMFAADVLAVVAGRIAGRSLPANAIRLGSSAIFFAVGGWVLLETLAHSHI